MRKTLDLTWNMKLLTFIQIEKPPQPKPGRFPPGQSLLRIIPAVPQKLVQAKSP